MEKGHSNNLTSLDLNHVRPYLVLLQFNFNFMTYQGICNLNIDKKYFLNMHVSLMVTKISFLTLLWVLSYHRSQPHV